MGGAACLSGVIVFTDSLFTGATHAVKLEVVSDDIIRVIAAPGKEIVTNNSLVTVYSKRPKLTNLPVSTNWLDQMFKKNVPTQNYVLAGPKCRCISHCRIGNTSKWWSEYNQNHFSIEDNGNKGPGADTLYTNHIIG